MNLDLAVIPKPNNRQEAKVSIAKPEMKTVQILMLAQINNFESHTMCFPACQGQLRERKSGNHFFYTLIKKDHYVANSIKIGDQNKHTEIRNKT